MRVSRHEVLLAAVLVIGALLACKNNKKGKAEVNCLGQTEQINCDVKHVEGNAQLGVCWDLQFDCANGTVASVQGVCQDVDPGATSQRVIPISQLSNFDKCDKAVGSQVKNMKVTVK